MHRYVALQSAKEHLPLAEYNVSFNRLLAESQLDLPSLQRRLDLEGFQDEAEMIDNIKRTEKALQKAKNREMGVDEEDAKVSSSSICVTC